MSKHVILSFFILFTILVLSLRLGDAASNGQRQVYIVYMGSLPLGGEYSPTSHHESILQDVLGDGFVNDRLILSYKRSFNGFAANLTAEEANKIKSMDSVVSVFPSTPLRLQTTRSWDFMGLSETVKRNPTVESNVIIGIIDGGISADSESFSDEGFGPPPKKWKGICQTKNNFTCNNKLIGARYYISNDTAWDDARGHGTHSASIAAGNQVTADFYGLAKGNARGAVPSARIASYKVCERLLCYSEFVLAAFDDSISDGVDIISISLFNKVITDFSEDVLAIGAFHALQKGILTSVAAGNNGPDFGTTANVMPWVLSVAASTIDRAFKNKAVLGDGTTITGESFNSLELSDKKYPLIYGKTNLDYCPEFTSRDCTLFCVNDTLVKGKIIVCDEEAGPYEAFRVAAQGSMAPMGSSIIPLPLDLPVLAFNNEDHRKVISYVQSAKKPEASIYKSEERKDDEAPVVPLFSSRGPSSSIPDILKPDITAPGIDILAAYPSTQEPSQLPKDERRVKYSLSSGTSVSCPHATGAAAYVKTFHPDWSPSSIKSALMTTAWVMNATKNPDGELSYGSGHINPVKAVAPGLVYDASTEDYVKLLCSLGYDTGKLRRITKDNSSCPSHNTGTPKDLNYPSMAAQVKSIKPFTFKFPRTVTNVGPANSTYKATITTTNRSKLKIDVSPSVLSFKSSKEKKAFVVTVNGAGIRANSSVSASLVWSDGVHIVRSPIVVFTYGSPA